MNRRARELSLLCVQLSLEQGWLACFPIAHVSHVILHFTFTTNNRLHIGLVQMSEQGWINV